MVYIGELLATLQCRDLHVDRGICGYNSAQRWSRNFILACGWEDKAESGTVGELPSGSDVSGAGEYR